MYAFAMKPLGNHWRKLREVEKLSPGDCEAVLRFVDTLLVRQRAAGGPR